MQRQCPALMLILAIGLLAFALPSQAQSKKKNEGTILDEAKAKVDKVSLLILRKGQVIAKMLGKSANNNDDGSIEVTEATFSIYPSANQATKQDDKNAKLGDAIATIKAKRLVWHRDSNFITLSESVALEWLASTAKDGEKKMTLRAKSAELHYQIGDHQSNSTLSLKKAKEVVFDGLQLKVSAPLMTLKLSLAKPHQKSPKSDASDQGVLSAQHVESLVLNASNGASVAFPQGFIDVIRDADTRGGDARFSASNGGLAKVTFHSEPQSESDPLKLRMGGKVRVLEDDKNQALMQATRLELDANIPKEGSTAKDSPRNFVVERLVLIESAFASMREVEARGDRISVEMESELERELVISGGALVSIEPKAAAGEARARSLNRVELRATKEIRILEARDALGLSQQSAISALEDAEALFGLESDAAFRLRGNEVHFTLQRSIEEARSTNRARYSLRNLSEFACFGAGVRPLLTWHEGGERRLALFAEALESDRTIGEMIKVSALGPKVRIVVLSNKGRAGIGRVLNHTESVVNEIWLTADDGIKTTLPLSLIDPDADEVGAALVELVAQKGVKYEELDESGKTFNAVVAQGMTFSLTFKPRQDEGTRREIEVFELALGRIFERSVRMGLGTDVIYASTASIIVRDNLATIRLQEEVASWWHSPAMLTPMKALYQQISQDEDGPEREPDQIHISTDLLRIETNLVTDHTRVFLPNQVEVNVRDSGRVRWGLGMDALIGHERQAGISPDILASVKAKNLTINRELKGSSARTPNPMTLTAKDSSIKATSMDFSADQQRASSQMKLTGPVECLLHDRGMVLILGTLKRGVAGAKTKPSAYAKGMSVTTKGDLFMTSKRSSSVDSKSNKTIRETAYTLKLPKPFTITGQEANDPITNAEGRKDTLKAGSLNVDISKIDAPESTSEGNVPVIRDFRMEDGVDLDFKDNHVKGERLFYDRTSDRFVLGGAKSETKKVGIIVEGVKRVEVRFPILNQKKKEAGSKTRREWRIVGNGIKVRRPQESQNEESKE